MQDAVTGLIGRYDQQGRYLDRSAIEQIDAYFAEADLRLAAVALINREAAEISTISCVTPPTPWWRPIGRCSMSGS